MPVETRYWDAAAFIGWLRPEPELEVGCGDVLKAAKGGKLTIVASTLAIAEVPLPNL